MLVDRCQAYLIAKTPVDSDGLAAVVHAAGFLHSLDIVTGKGSVDPAARIKYFFVHFSVPDHEIRFSMEKVRASQDPDLRFSPFVMITRDCAYDDAIRYAHLGFDDVISLPEKANVIRKHLETMVMHEQTYIETPTYLGPDRRRLDTPAQDNRRLRTGGVHTRYRFRRDVRDGVVIIRQVLLAA
jgi:hypothetical protein